ncbi:MAG: competence/damage-inducible protein A [Nitrospinales bacterium]
MFYFKEDVPKAEILTIGNEIVSGLVQDTNAVYISHSLASLGINVVRMTSICDDEKAIVRALNEAKQVADIVIVTGGLGPTHDDITKQVFASYFNSPLVRDERVFSMVENFFSSRGKIVPDFAMGQCDVPEKAEILYNEKGTAPGMLFRDDGKMFFSLPGVPLEMKYLLDEQVLPFLGSDNKLNIKHRILKTTGVTESGLWEMVGSIEFLKNKMLVASLPSHLGVRLRLSVMGKDAADTISQLDKAEKFFREKISKYIYAVDDETLEGNISRKFRDKNITLAVAESCTGGLIGHRLTNIPGSSDFFNEGAVTYSNEAKINRLGVNSDLIKQHGAVSKEVAMAMAMGIKNTSGSDIGLAVTGIAGPAIEGDTKPVGLTFVALSEGDNVICEKFNFTQDRVRNKERSAQAALNLLRLHLQNK